MLWLLLKTEGQPQHSRHPVQQEEEADSKTLIRIQVLWVLPYFSSFLISPSSLPPQPREGGTADANGLHPKCEKKKWHRFLSLYCIYKPFGLTCKYRSPRCRLLQMHDCALR